MPWFDSRNWAFGATAFVAVMLAGAVCTGQGRAPDQTLLAQRGEQSLAKLDADIFSWTAMHSSPHLPTFRVDTLHLPDMRRMTVSIMNGDFPQLLVRVYERDGLWYVQEGDLVAKYRPYEAPFEQPVLYSYLAQSELRRVEAQQSLGDFTGVEENLALYRVAPNADEAARLANIGKGLHRSLEQFRAERAKANKAFAATVAKVQEQIKKAKGQGGGDKKNKGGNAKVAGMLNDLRQAMIAHSQLEAQRDENESAFKDRIAQAQSLAESGALMKIDGRSGVVMQWGIENQVEIRNIRRHEPSEIDPSWFAVDLISWLDMAPPRADSDYQQLAMFNHNASWRPGGPNATATAVLADLSGGRLVRVPFRGGIASGGCFSADRRKVYVTGQLVTEPAVGLFEIDLTTGENRRLGGETLAAGFVDSPSLSGDGKRLVVLHKPSLFKAEAQVYTVDIASGDAQPIGEPRKVSSPSWLPNESGIVLAVEENGGSTVQRLDLDGQLTLLEHGRSPQVLLPRDLILYDAGSSEGHSWMTCEADGRRAQQVGGGLPEFESPSPSAYGTELLMLKLGGEQGPRPYIVNIDSGEAREVTLGLGRWMNPVWR